MLASDLAMLIDETAVSENLVKEDMKPAVDTNYTDLPQADIYTSDSDS